MFVKTCRFALGRSGTSPLHLWQPLACVWHTKTLSSNSTCNEVILYKLQKVCVHHEIPLSFSVHRIAFVFSKFFFRYPNHIPIKFFSCDIGLHWYCFAIKIFSCDIKLHLHLKLIAFAFAIKSRSTVKWYQMTSPLLLSWLLPHFLQCFHPGCWCFGVTLCFLLWTKTWPILMVHCHWLLCNILLAFQSWVRHEVTGISHAATVTNCSSSQSQAALQTLSCWHGRHGQGAGWRWWVLWAGTRGGYWCWSKPGPTSRPEVDRGSQFLLLRK